MKVLFSGDCRLNERLMEMNHIRLQSSSWSSPSTFRTGDYIYFQCKWWYRQVSRPEKFRAVCWDGVITYPTCECKCLVARTQQGCTRQLCWNCPSTALRKPSGVCQAWSSCFFPFSLFQTKGFLDEWKWHKGAQLWKWRIPQPTSWFELNCSWQFPFSCGFFCSLGNALSWNLLWFLWSDDCVYILFIFSLFFL